MFHCSTITFFSIGYLTSKFRAEGIFDGTRQERRLFVRLFKNSLDQQVKRIETFYVKRRLFPERIHLSW